MKCSSVCCMAAIESYVTLVSFFLAALSPYCSAFVLHVRQLKSKRWHEEAAAIERDSGGENVPFERLRARGVSGGNATGLGPSLRWPRGGGWSEAPSGCLRDGHPGEGESTSLDSNSLMWRHSPRQAPRGRASLPILTLL